MGGGVGGYNKNWLFDGWKKHIISSKISEIQDFVILSSVKLKPVNVLKFSVTRFVKIIIGICENNNTVNNIVLPKGGI